MERFLRGSRFVKLLDGGVALDVLVSRPLLFRKICALAHLQIILKGFYG